MVEDHSTAAPPSDEGRGGGESPCVDEHHVAGAVERRRLVLGDQDGPAARRRLSGDGDVSTQADQHAAGANHVVCPGGRDVRAQGLGGRAQVDLGAGRQPRPTPRAVHLDRAPSGHPLRADGDRPAARRQRGEVPVVANDPQRPPDGRVDRAFGDPRRPDRRLQRIEEDLIDQLFNSSEKRLARALLLLARYCKQDKPVRAVPKISQETLAEMVGTTRSRVNFFMKKFQRLGFIDYKDGLKVNNVLLTVVLHE